MPTLRVLVVLEFFGMVINLFFLIGSFVATCRLTCSEISLLMFKQRKKLERSPGNGRTMY